MPHAYCTRFYPGRTVQTLSIVRRILAFTAGVDSSRREELTDILNLQRKVKHGEDRCYE